MSSQTPPLFEPCVKNRLVHGKALICQCLAEWVGTACPPELTLLLTAASACLLVYVPPNVCFYHAFSCLVCSSPSKPKNAAVRHAMPCPSHAGSFEK